MTDPGEAVLLIRRPPREVFDLFRCQMLTAFRQWIIDIDPTSREIEAEIEATIRAMRVMTTQSDNDPPDVWDWDDPARLRKEIARLREYLHMIEKASTLELAVNQAALALYM